MTMIYLVIGNAGTRFPIPIWILLLCTLIQTKILLLFYLGLLFIVNIFLLYFSGNGFIIFWDENVFLLRITLVAPYLNI